MTGRLVSRTALNAAERAAMFALLNTHFDGVIPEQFDADLAEKNWAVLIEHGNELVGFSTLKVFETTVDGERLTVVRSGDTIVAPSAWGSAVFPKAWITAVYQLRQRHPHGRLLWLLLTSGFRTYRFLPVFWEEFYPRHDRTTPLAWERLLRTVAATEFGDRFDADRGIVRFERPHRLSGTLASVPAHRLSDPHVTFFLTRNPGHVDGDELVCLADLDPTNLTAAGRRVVYGAAR